MDSRQIQLKESPAVAMVGMVTLDYLYVLDAYPAEGTTNAARHQRIVAGGPVGRGAITAGRLGGRVTLLAMCGNDLHADALKSELAREPIEEILFARDQPSQHSCVIAADDTGSRTIVWTPQPRADQRLLNVLEQVLREVDAVLLDCTDPVLSQTAAGIGRRLGIPVVVDTGSYRTSSEDYLSEIDYIIAPEKFFTARHPENTLEDAMNKVYAEFAPAVLAATRGEQGGLYIDESGTHTYSACRVSVIDSSGAGDTFHGAFTWAIAAGAPTQLAFRIAAWAAAQKCRAVGNEGLPGAEAFLTSWPSLTG
jgi:sugar/nucleoside kinase (ribokinase family)